MKITAITMTCAAALAVAGCGQKPSSTTTIDNSTTMTSVDSSTTNDGAAMTPAAGGSQAFANNAAASDAFEIESSKLALAGSQSKSVKAFAQKMIDAHTDSTAKLKIAAASSSPAITPNPTLTADQQAKLEAMKALSGKAFDEAYIAAQSEGHQMTLDALKAYTVSGDVPQLKTFASTLVPIVTAHLNMAKSLKA